MPKLEVQFGAPDFVPLCDPRPFHLTSKDGKRSHIIDGCVCEFPGRDRGGEGPGQAFYEVRIITRHGENAGLWNSLWCLSGAGSMSVGGRSFEWGRPRISSSSSIRHAAVAKSPKTVSCRDSFVRRTWENSSPQRPCFPKNCVRFLIRLCLPPPTWHRWHRAEGICQFQSPNSSTPMSEHVNVCNHPGPWNLK